MTNNTLDRVIKSIAATTRYPVQLLTADADLENDLGIDSVKRLEVILDLSDEFQMRLDREPRDSSVRTIQDVARWIDQLVHQQTPSLSRRIDPASASIPRPLGAESANPRPSTAESHDHVNPSQSSTVKMRNAVSDSTSDTVSTLSHSRYHQNGFASISRPESEPWEASNGKSGQKAGRPLQGKVALVTGSGHGVGQTTARLLASRGATVIVNSFHSRELGERTTSEINERGDSAIHLWGSVANPAHVDEMFQQIRTRFGRLDILVCNASDGRIGSLMEVDHEDWDRAFRTNVVGHHRCAVRAASLMRTHGGGSIVTMSAVGSHGYIEGLGTQGVVKAAVETMTRYLACELGQFGIRVNCIVGGPVYGELLSKFANSQSAQHHWESMTPDGTLCCSMDLANAIGFLVSTEATGVNGAVWNVDHGFSATADGRPLRYSTATQLV
ncbi:SDR family oxidoreductase [Pirellulaceae bacterium SH501]